MLFDTEKKIGKVEVVKYKIRIDDAKRRNKNWGTNAPSFLAAKVGLGSFIGIINPLGIRIQSLGLMSKLTGATSSLGRKIGGHGSVSNSGCLSSDIS